MINYSVATLADLKAALAASAIDGVADVITLTADLSATSSADFVTGAGGYDLLKIAITDGQGLSIVGGGHTLDANYFGRVLEVSSGMVAISDLTIREGGLSGNGGDYDQAGGAALGAGIYNSANLTLTNVVVTANAASGGGGGGGSTHGYGGGGGGAGGGGLGSVAGAGGAGYEGAPQTENPGAAASGGTGGAGAGAYSSGGGGSGGAHTGGAGGWFNMDSVNHGGDGGTAAIGGFSIGGGGGGSGMGDATPRGGAAVGGIYNTGTLLLSGSTVSGNIAAGGGGGGSENYTDLADGGAAVGGIQNIGALTLDNSSVTGNVAAGGGGGADGAGWAAGGGADDNILGNQLHTGGVSVSGTATQGQTLTAANTLADGNGLGTISYQWTSDGTDISGATGSTFVLTQAQVGHGVAVTARYTDGAGFAESATSSATSSVANANHLPTGAVTISGTATQGQVLSASNTLADADGLGTIHYQWAADGTDISGATGSTLTLDQAEVGHAITVAASYTDGFGAAESVNSTASAAVASITPPPPSDPSPPAPVTSVGTVDGASVSTTTTTAADGSQTHVIAVEPIGHPDPGVGGSTADIPLVSVGDSHLITVGVPTGTGFSASGSVAPGSASSASPALIGSIHTGASAADQQQMDDGANDFLHLHSTAPVLAQTIILTGAHADTPFAITGLADSGTVTAVVIDTHNVAGQSVLTLDNVDFAAVIGEAHITGGAGSQTVYADSAPQYMVLGADDDVLHGGGGADTVGSIGGDDSIYGDDGDDDVFGGIGNDVVYGGADEDVVQGNQGDDVVQGNAGNDLVYGGQGADIVYGGQGDDQVFGDLGNDTVFGNLGNDTITGGDGDDVVQGNQGDDSVQGGAGNDLVYGGQGADTVDGGPGDDRLFGDLGDDVLHGGTGNDTLAGGAGADTFLYAKGDGADRITDFNQSEGDHIQLVGTHGDYTTLQVGADTVLDFGGGQSIVLVNVQVSSLTSGWIAG